MQAIFGHSWLAYVSDERQVKLSKAEWLGALAGLELWCIKRGLDVCRDTLDYPPSIKRFKSLAMGILNLPAASALAKQKNFTTGLIRCAWELAGGDWGAKNENAEKFDKKFREFYEVLASDELEACKRNQEIALLEYNSKNLLEQKNEKNHSQD